MIIFGEIMPLIGFTVLKDKILSGEKRQTIRRARKRAIKVGDTLYLYWKLRTKECQLLTVATCMEALRLKYADFCCDEEIAKRDGFENSEELRKWFTKKHNPKPDDLFDIIRW